MARLALAMSDRTELAERLGYIARVLKLQAIVTWAMRLLVLGLVLDCLWLAGSRFLPYGVRPAFLLIAPGALAVVGAIMAACWHISAQRVARRADHDLGLKERLVTAVELRQQGTTSPLVSLQIRDAIEQLRRYEALEAFPVRLPGRELNAMLALSLLAVGLVLAPNPMEQTVKQREQVAVTVRQEAERINKLADELAAEEDPEDFADITDILRQAGAAIDGRQLSPDEASAKLQQLEQKLLGSQDPSTGELQDALSALSGSLAAEPATRELGRNLAAGDIHDAAREMRRLGQEAGSLSAADKQKLARSLKEAANRVSRSNAALASAMQQAADALESGDPGQSASAMGESANQLENSAGRLRSATQRERALSQLQQSRGAINRSQQAAQSRNGSGQSGQSAMPGAGMGESSDDFGGSMGDDGDSGSGDRPGGSGAGSGQSSQDESFYDPMMTAGTPDFVPGAESFNPDDVFENPNPDTPYGNEAQVPYSQAYAQYQERATQTLQNSYIPAGLKDIVKDYFSALAPN